MSNVREAVIDGLANFRNAEFARLLTITLGLAAETHPEEVRKALARVFDLSAVEELHKRLSRVLAEHQAEVAAVPAEIMQARAELDRLREDARLDIEEMRMRLHKMHAWLTAKAKQLQQKAS